MLVNKHCKVGAYTAGNKYRGDLKNGADQQQALEDCAPIASVKAHIVAAQREYGD